MGYSPFDRTGQNINTDVYDVSVDEAFIAHFQVSAANAVEGNNLAVLAATTLTAIAQTIKTNITNPTVPRNIKIVGNTEGIIGNVIIRGTNYAGDSVTEIIALSGITEAEGAKAFKTVTEIDLPIQTHAGTDTVSVGFGEKLGIPYKLTRNTVLAAYLDNIKEVTAPIVTTNIAVLENNTIKLNSALSGKVVDIYMIV